MHYLPPPTKYWGLIPRHVYDVQMPPHYSMHQSCPELPHSPTYVTGTRCTTGSVLFAYYSRTAPGDAWIPVVSSIAILLFCKYCTYCSMCNTGFWQVIAHTMQYCNTDACGRDALCRHYVMSVFDRYMLQPAEEALWAQYMNVLLMGMSFSGSSTLFTSVRAIPNSGPVQVSAIL